MDDSHPRGDSSPVLSWECYRQHLWNPSSGLCLEVALWQESSSGLLSQRDRRKAQPSGWKVTARGTQGPGSQLLLHSPFRRGVTCQKSHSRAGQSRARLGGLLGSGAEFWLLPSPPETPESSSENQGNQMHLLAGVVRSPKIQPWCQHGAGHTKAALGARTGLSTRSLSVHLLVVIT